MQWFWGDIRVESRTATAADCDQEKVGKKALRLEQIAAGAWVKRQGWDCIADYLEGDNLLQVPVQVGGVTMRCWRSSPLLRGASTSTLSPAASASAFCLPSSASFRAPPTVSTSSPLLAAKLRAWSRAR